MRLFIAINFEENIKDKLYDEMAKFAEYAEKGNFTRWENLHLTVVFIGETNKVEAVKSAMNEIDANEFSMEFSGLGNFHRDGGDIWWRGIKPSKELQNIYNQLADELTIRGFKLEKRAFKPHLTWGRQVVMYDGFDKKDFASKLPALKVKINRISLMKSERIKGKLTYTEVYGFDLSK